MRYLLWLYCGSVLAIVLCCTADGQEAKKYLGRTAQEWIKIVKDKDSPHRMDGVEAMVGVGTSMAKEVGAEDIVAALTSALSDQRDIVRARAARGLGSFQRDAKSAVPALIQVIKDSSAAAKDGDADKKESEAFVRVHIIQTLGDIGPPAKAAVKILVEALKDSDRTVRKSAGEALKKIDPEAAKGAGVGGDQK